MNYSENSNYVKTILEHSQNEITALERYSPEFTSIGYDVHSIVNNVIGIALQRLRGKDDDISSLEALVAQYMRSTMAILSGNLLSPLRGETDEWQDVELAGDMDKVLTVEFRGTPYELKFKSIQVNVRYPKIFRFNKDNRLAHRTDAIRFIKQDNPNTFSTYPMSVRFIKFPYDMDVITFIEEGENRYLRPNDKRIYTKEDIMNSVAFVSDGAAQKCVLAPPIPHHMASKVCDLNEELNNVNL